MFPNTIFFNKISVPVHFANCLYIFVDERFILL